MLSKNKLKYIRSLSIKKYRDQEAAFVAEGPKIVEDIIEHFPCLLLLCTPEYLKSHSYYKANEIITVSPKELEQASSLKAPRDVIAIFSQQRTRRAHLTDTNRQQPLLLALDGVQDPGNLGTIIRLADWFGIGHIYCSHDCADAFSPKVIQATMGAIARVEVHYVDLIDFINNNSGTPIYGTFLDGEDIYEADLSQGGILLMGNEGKGISKHIERLVDKKLYIPSYPSNRETAESLNVATATAIACAEFRRQAIERNK